MIFLIHGASVCIHCDRAQNPWTRVLLRIGKFAGAGVTVIALGSGAYSLWKLIPLEAKLSIVPVSCKRKEIKVAIANLGDKPAILRSATLVLQNVPSSKGKKKSWPLTPSATIIESQKTAQVSLKWVEMGQAQKMPKKRVSMKSCLYSVDVHYADFEDQRNALKFDCECPK
jgi:hypothetical protein